MLLLAKAVCSVVKYIVYDEETETVNRISESEVIENILNRKILNAKLENAVIKMTDGMIRKVDKNSVHKLFYMLYCKDEIYTAIDMSGEKYIMSANVLRDFFSKDNKEIINVTFTNKSILIDKHRNFITPLSRETEHQRD